MAARHLLRGCASSISPIIEPIKALDAAYKKTFGARHIRFISSIQIRFTVKATMDSQPG